MKKLIDFEYDLWITEDGRCIVRVRRTKEECEVNREIFRLLRAEEKRMRRKKTLEKRDDLPDEAARPPLSLHIRDTEEEGTSWHTDPTDLIEESILDLTVEQFRSQLTEKQLDVFEKCLLGDMSLRAYAREKGCAFATVKGIQDEIRMKFKNIL